MRNSYRKRKNPQTTQRTRREREKVRENMAMKFKLSFTESILNLGAAVFHRRFCPCQTLQTQVSNLTADQFNHLG